MLPRPRIRMNQTDLCPPRGALFSRQRLVIAALVFSVSAIGSTTPAFGRMGQPAGVNVTAAKYGEQLHHFDLPAADEPILGQGMLEYRLDGVQLTSKLPATALAVDTQVQMNISGWINRVSVKQVFVNDSEHWLNGRYQFPLPHDAAVDNLKLHIGQRVIIGEIQPKAVARQTFEQAKASGKKASLVSQQRPNIFTSEVANLGPGEELVVEIAYQQQVRYQDGEFSLRFPTAITPRYFPKGQAPDLEQVSVNDIQGLNALNEGAQSDEQKLYLDVVLDAGMAISRLETPYHQMRQTQLGGTKIGLNLTANLRPDRDFLLKWRPLLAEQPSAVMFAQLGKTHEFKNHEFKNEESLASSQAHNDQVVIEAKANHAAEVQASDKEAKDSYALVMLMPPQDKARVRLPRELTLVIDTSGSMTGDSIAQAKSAILNALAGLGSQDTFNVIAFDSSVRSLSPVALSATAANLGKANLFVQSLEADGGTEMAPALLRALSQPESGVSPISSAVKPERLKQVVFITDGAVGNEASLFALIAANIGRQRLFTVGIGAAPNGYFMERAARAGRGTYTYVGKISEVDAKIGELLEKIESPQISDVTLTLDDGSIPDYWPVQIGDLYAHEPIMVALRLTPAQRSRSDALIISGDLDGKNWQRRLALTGGDKPKGIDLIWARNQIASLQLSKNAKNQAAIKESVTRLAMYYHLVSPYTSLVAVDRTPSRPEAMDAMELFKPAPMPMQNQWPQTATESRLYLALGAMMLLLIGAYWVSYLPCLRGLWRRRLEA
ncbi:marine proteobacterial sortase target protein [Shewanella rhizosphaerae]|uniref:marine proteobacterial sortase target protein n=1 Tax=Shewanella rhizosphaerae TaxID=2864207 RepID=UPI001C66224D|nr:marine proteobacterial sortase target protein [Shewanella rhizosphaerae]QYK14633.1 marine proteobacterial sortase target protein [Shewanella rhizosphaerae]